MTSTYLRSQTDQLETIPKSQIFLMFIIFLTNGTLKYTLFIGYVKQVQNRWKSLELCMNACLMAQCHPKNVYWWLVTWRIWNASQWTNAQSRPCNVLGSSIPDHLLIAVHNNVSNVEVDEIVDSLVVWCKILWEMKNRSNLVLTSSDLHSKFFLKMIIWKL